MQQKNELKHKVEAFQKDVRFLNTSLQVYGYASEHDPLTLESIKKVFEENQSLKIERDRLFENIEGSRHDLHIITATNKSAVQGIPTMVTQQYRAVKEQYEQQVEQMQRQFNQKILDNTNDMQRMRARIIEIIDEKTRLETESSKLR